VRREPEYVEGGSEAADASWITPATVPSAIVTSKRTPRRRLRAFLAVARSTNV